MWAENPTQHVGRNILEGRDGAHLLVIRAEKSKIGYVLLSAISLVGPKK